MLSGTGRCLTLQRLAFATAVISAAQPVMSRTAEAAAAERILDDSGGRIGAYLSRYEALPKSGQHVAIDGTCASACTLLLGAARGAGFPRGLGSQHDGCSEQRSRDQIFVVALSGRRAPVDRAARRIAIPNYLSGRARTGSDVPDLSLATADGLTEGLGTGRAWNLAIALWPRCRLRQRLP
jgi:hypothetical protein